MFLCAESLERPQSAAHGESLMTRRQERETAFHAQLEVTEIDEEIDLDDMPIEWGRAARSRLSPRPCAGTRG